MTKAEIRKEYLDKRKSLSDTAYIEKCQRVADYFFTYFDLSFVKTLHVFLPITANKEPDTWIIIDRIRREFPAIRLSVPRINASTNSIESFYFEGLHQLKKGQWGIQEPKQGVPTPSSDIDMILVPLLAFDLHGHRVGYGKGYYDRFLATCRPDCKKVGLSLFEPTASIPAEQQDIPLTWCITPKKVYKID